MVMHDDPNRTYAKGVIGKNYLSGAVLGDCDGVAMKGQKKPIDIARDAMQSAINLAERVEAIVDDIVGTLPPVPRACEQVVGGPVDGVLPGLAEHASRTNAAIRDAHAALDRLREVI